MESRTPKHNPLSVSKQNSELDEQTYWPNPDVPTLDEDEDFDAEVERKLQHYRLSIGDE